VNIGKVQAGTNRYSRMICVALVSLYTVHFMCCRRVYQKMGTTVSRTDDNDVRQRRWREREAWYVRWQGTV